ncbi:MAG TPA: hypothetical protein PK830_09050 [Candidatus Atribacteria bacterium]|nr:hypothetical protein [Candidatus Atribacteria bacterium]HPT79232.1 hypothetical protein [Candidatus Atribacteria bacterium]
MYKIKINKEVLKNHIQYDWWKYAVSVAVTVLVWSMIVTVTAPRTPGDKKVDIYLVGGYMFEDPASKIEQRILSDFPDLLEINLHNILLEGQMEYVGRQKFLAMLFGQEGDIFILDQKTFKDLAREGALLPLDDYEGIKGRMTKEQIEKGTMAADESSEPKLYGVPLAGFKLFEDTYDTKNAVLCIMSYSDNIPKAVEVTEWILENGQ